MQIRLLIATIMLLLAMAGKAQIFQTNNTPYKFRGVKADSLLIIPVGCDTPLTSNPKWGTATDGAMFLKTCDTTLWVKMGQRFIQVNGTASITGGDTTIFQVTLDSTGQPNNRLLFSRNNYISSSPKILIDSANSRLIINNNNVSIGGAGMQLYVVGNGTFAGFLRVGTFEIYGISTPVTDTTIYKPLAINSSGSVRKMDRWIGGGSSIDTTSLSNRIDLKADKAINLYAGDGLVGGGDLSANRSFRVDTLQVANKVWVNDRLADKLNIADSAFMLSSYFRTAWFASYFDTRFALKTTSHLAEGSNLYYTDARSRTAISLTTTGTSGAATYNNSTGVLNVPNYASGGSGGITGIGTFSSTGNANGASISGTDLILHPATATQPGGVSTGPQTWAGDKTFNDLIRTKNAQSNTPGASIYLRDYTGAGERVGIGRGISDMHFFGRAGYGFRWYGGGDFNTSATDWLSLTESALRLGAGVELRLSTPLKTVGAQSNTSQASIYLRDYTGAGNQIGIGRGIADVHFFGMNDYGFRWYGGGQFNTGATNWLYLDQNGLAVTGSNSASAILTVNSTTKGFLPPRMTTTQKNAIGSPTAGLIVFDTTLGKLCVYTGSAWETITSLSFGFWFLLSLIPSLFSRKKRLQNNL